MSDQEASAIRAGHLTVGVLLVFSLAGTGFSRFEDRAIIGMPGSPANAMAAFAAAEASGPPETYSAPPEDSVSLSEATRAPTDRIKRALQERDVPTVASRQILGTPDAPVADETAQPVELAPVVPTVDALPGSEAPAPTFAALASPPLAAQGAPIFAAAPLATDGDAVGGGAGGVADGGGQDDGGTDASGDGAPPVVSPVPEPGTWLMLILGLFGIGSALRHRTALQTRRARA